MNKHAFGIEYRLGITLFESVVQLPVGRDGPVLQDARFAEDENRRAGGRCLLPAQVMFPDQLAQLADVAMVEPGEELRGQAQAWLAFFGAATEQIQLLGVLQAQPGNDQHAALDGLDSLQRLRIQAHAVPHSYRLAAADDLPGHGGAPHDFGDLVGGAQHVQRDRDTRPHSSFQCDKSEHIHVHFLPVTVHLRISKIYKPVADFTTHPGFTFSAHVSCRGT